MAFPPNAFWLCPVGHGPVAGRSTCPQCGLELVPATRAVIQPAPPADLSAFAFDTPATPAPPPVQTVPLGPGGVPAGIVLGAPGSMTVACAECGSDGSRLPPERLVCNTCRWLRPLAPGYRVEPSAFMWAQDGAAMARLRSVGPLMAAARAVSDRVGRPWVESMFNGVRLGDNQLPDLWGVAVRAARLLGLPRMPDVYITGDRMWDCATFGSDRSAFILVGTALVNSFRGDDLLFVLAREMGHCVAGHALWKTVGTFLLGEQGPRRGVMSGGALAALNPSKIVEGALEMPLLGWARQAEITADRAGLLAVGDEGVARRVLLSWSLRSIALYQRINIDAWLSQQEDADDQMTRLSELMSSPTPYITRRLKTLQTFARSPELAHMRSILVTLDRTPPSPPPAPPRPVAPGPVASAPQFLFPEATPAPLPVKPAAAPPASDAEYVRLKCPGCSMPLRVPRAALEGKEVFHLRCASPACGKVTTLRRGASPPKAGPPASPPPPATRSNPDRENEMRGNPDDE